MTVSPRSLVEERLPAAGQPLPLIVEPAVPGVDLAAWAEGERGWLDEKLLAHGGILFRGFGVRSAGALERFIEAVSGQALEYRERSSPRSQVAGNIYTSTDYPASQPIFLHNENSYQDSWPLRIFFCCETAAEAGGETPIADTRRVAAAIPGEVRERFERLGWMYVRNFGDGFGLPWQTVFQTTDRAAVESYCREHAIVAEWRDGDRLRIRRVRPAVARHPRSGERLWFNHATFFHVTTLEPEVRDSLLAELREEELPTNTYYGDGSPIEPEVLGLLRAAYRGATVAFPWREGDLLLLDNMLTAHGRSPFRGARKILVGMSDPVTRAEA